MFIHTTVYFAIIVTLCFTVDGDEGMNSRNPELIARHFGDYLFYIRKGDFQKVIHKGKSELPSFISDSLGVSAEKSCEDTDEGDDGEEGEHEVDCEKQNPKCPSKKCPQSNRKQQKLHKICFKHKCYSRASTEAPTTIPPTQPPPIRVQQSVGVVGQPYYASQYVGQPYGVAGNNILQTAGINPLLVTNGQMNPFGITQIAAVNPMNQISHLALNPYNQAARIQPINLNGGAYYGQGVYPQVQTQLLPINMQPISPMGSYLQSPFPAYNQGPYGSGMAMMPSSYPMGPMMGANGGQFGGGMPMSMPMGGMMGATGGNPSANQAPSASGGVGASGGGSSGTGGASGTGGSEGGSSGGTANQVASNTASQQGGNPPGNISPTG